MREPVLIIGGGLIGSSIGWRLAQQGIACVIADASPLGGEASTAGAYTLSDLPTFLMNQAPLALKVLVRGDARLRNPYGVIAVNPTRVPGTDYAGAMSFIDFLTSSVGQDLIRDYERERFGTAMFHPLVETESVD